MLCAAYEFEVMQSEGYFTAIPYDLEGATQGEDWSDLVDMVLDWLKVYLEDCDMHGKSLPKATFGNAPRYGGTNLVVAMQAGRETVEKVTATEAARLLGVSRGRISQMLKSALLEGWQEGRNTYVTVDSLKCRLDPNDRWGTDGEGGGLTDAAHESKAPLYAAG